MSFVADDEIELGEAVLLLCVRDHLYRLVGGKHHRHLVRGLRLRIGGELGRIGGGRVSEIMDIDIADVVAALVAFADLRIGAHRKRPQRRRGVERPFAHRLAHQRQRWHEEQNELAGTGEVFRDLEAGEGLARAARHNELAAIRRRESAAHRIERIALVRTHFLLGREHDLIVSEVGPPVDGTLLQPLHADAGS